MRELGRERWLWALLAVILAGAAARFATLDVQSFWLDEAVTHELVTRSLGGMLGAIPDSESTPPLYYLLAWVWVRIVRRRRGRAAVALGAVRDGDDRRAGARSHAASPARGRRSRPRRSPPPARC